MVLVWRSVRIDGACLIVMAIVDEYTLVISGVACGKRGAGTAVVFGQLKFAGLLIAQTNHA